MINTYIPFINSSEKKHLNYSLKSNYISTYGPIVKNFENKFSKKFNFKYSIALNSGTSALHAALIAANVKKDDIVIVPSYTFAATVNVISYLGAIPWFFDCDKNLILDADQIKKTFEKKTEVYNNKLILKKNKKIIKCLIVVQSMGQNIEFKTFENLAKKNNLKIIFDSAACHDPKIFDFKKNKSSSFCFSFNGNKTITTGSGGMFSTNSLKLANKVKILSSVGKKINQYDYHEIGYNYKMSNLQASLGLSQLNKLEIIKKHKKRIFNYYQNNLKLVKQYKLFTNKKFVTWVFAMLVRNTKQFKKIKNIFNKHKIQLDHFWKPLHLQKPYKKFYKESLSICEKKWDKVLILPSHPNVKNKDLKKICYLLNQYL